MIYTIMPKKKNARCGVCRHKLSLVAQVAGRCSHCTTLFCSTHLAAFGLESATGHVCPHYQAYLTKANAVLSERNPGCTAVKVDAL